MVWKLIGRWAEYYGLSKRTPNRQYKLTAQEWERRLAILWRNTVRINFFFNGAQKIPYENYDQTPLHMNEMCPCFCRLREHLTVVDISPARMLMFAKSFPFGALECFIGMRAGSRKSGR